MTKKQDMQLLRHVCVGFCAMAAVAALPAVSQSEEEPAPLQLLLQPAAEPEAALTYRLLPPALDLRPGNAAVLYNKLAIEYPGKGRDRREVRDRMSDWLALPLAKLPIDEVRAFLKPSRKLLDDLHMAARRRRCDWELPLGERDYLSTALPELMPARNFGQLLALEAQIQMSEHRFDDALRTLQTGFALARHVSSGSMFIHALVARDISGNMEQMLFDWPTQPGSPNLYWALTALPRPLIDLRQIIDTEGESLYWSFPELKDLESDSHSAKYWDDVLDRLLAFVAQAIDHPDNWEERLPLALLAIKELPRAKASLIERGFSDERVRNMPVSQVLLLDAVCTYKIERDRDYKRLCLAYHEVPDDWRGSSYLGPRPIIPLAIVLSRAVDSMHFGAGLHDRAIALLRIIEAIRAYGALHGGELPDRLEELSDLPIPTDPVTGGPFLYKRQENSAILETPPPRTEPEHELRRRYELRFAN